MNQKEKIEQTFDSLWKQYTDINPEVKKMVQQFDKVDAVLGDDDFKKENFGKYAKKYEYQPIVRYPPSDEDEENQDRNVMIETTPVMEPSGGVDDEMSEEEAMVI